jgi:hypothetical protein
VIDLKDVDAIDALDDQYRLLRLAADQFTDMQLMRIATGNRLRHAPAGLFDDQIHLLTEIEKAASKALKRTYRDVVPEPVREWVAAQRGVGEHTVARILGAIGHPVVAIPKWWIPGSEAGSTDERVLVQGEPQIRSVSQLWSYCALGDPTRRRTKGMTQSEAMASGNVRIKSLLYLNTTQIRKAGEHTPGCVLDLPDGQSTYDTHRCPAVDGTFVVPGGHGMTDTHSSDAVRDDLCLRCYLDLSKLMYSERGWTKGHADNAAIRRTSKEFLRRLYNLYLTTLA